MGYTIFVERHFPGRRTLCLLAGAFSNKPSRVILKGDLGRGRETITPMEPPWAVKNYMAPFEKHCGGSGRPTNALASQGLGFGTTLLPLLDWLLIIQAPPMLTPL